MRIFALLLVGCTSPAVDPPAGREPRLEEPPQVPPVIGVCSEQVSLYGMTGSATPTTVGPFTIQSEGVDICLELDGRDNLQVADFAASTPYEQNTTSSMFQLTLLDHDGNVLRESWDVTFGDSPPTTFANLEYGVTKGTVLSAVLHVAAKCVPLGTTVSVALFEPYE